MWIQAILVVVLVSLLILHFRRFLQASKKYPPGLHILRMAPKFIQSGFSMPPDMLTEVLHAAKALKKFRSETVIGAAKLLDSLTNESCVDYQKQPEFSLCNVATSYGPSWPEETAKEYGNIFTIWGGPMPMVVLSGLQTVIEALVNNSEAFAERPVTPLYEVLTHGNGIVLANGDLWKEQRNFGVKTFRKLGMGKSGMELKIQAEAEHLVEAFAKTKGQPLDPSVLLRYSVLNVMSALIFGHRYAFDEESLKLMESIDYCMKFSTSAFHFMYEAAPWLMKHVKCPYKKLFSSADFVTAYIRNETEEHREQLAPHNPQDFIDYYLLQIEKSKNDPTTTFDETNLVQSTSDLFFSGIHTTTATLEWAVLIMVIYPDVQEKVQKEIDEALGPTVSISYQDWKKLPYTMAVLHEIQRFKCIILAVGPRKTVEDVTILGTLIPKGAMIIADLRSIIYDPKIWETPQKFNPNHFLDKDGNFVDRKELLLFGAGARMCLGKDLAKMDTFIIFTSLMRAFTLKLPEGVKEVSLEPIKGLTSSPQHYKLCAIRRSIQI